MCSDVDRNDKSRVCEPGSVRVIGRRQIEMYSRLIHTVDHIEGRLREGMDAFDAFLSPCLGGHRHRRAETVGDALHRAATRRARAPGMAARSAWSHFNGDLNTGLTLRTIRIKDGIAEVRAGATLLYDSVPEEEEAETELKASAMLSAIRDAKRRQFRQHRTHDRRASATASTSCSSTTRTASSTRSPTISARPAPMSRPCARRCRTRCSTG